MLRFVVQWLVPIALAIFAWVDCLLTPRPYVRMLPKTIWAVLIVVPYLGALLWIFTGRTLHPREPWPRPRRRATDVPGVFGSFGRPGSHQARPRIIDTPGSRARTGTGAGTGIGTPPSTWAVAPDDDPEFLRQLGEQLKKNRPES